MAKASLKRHLALIPARGGSKRLPRKNVMDFLGRPMLSYTISAAEAAGIFDQILVSTEDNEIAAVARKWGGVVDERPVELGGDEIGIATVCFELLSRLARAGQDFTTMSILYATAPLRNTEDIRATWSLLKPGLCDYAMAVTEFSQPVHQALMGTEEGMVPIFPDLVTTRKNEVPRYYAGNGSTYCVNVDAFLRTGVFYGPGLQGHVMPAERSVDIDTRTDYELAVYFAGKIGLRA